MADIETRGDVEVRIRGESEYIADVTSGKRLMVEASFAAGVSTEVVIKDSDGDYVDITPDQRMRVTTAPGYPTGTTRVTEGGTVTVTKKGGTNTFNWIIPNGQTFHLSKFEFGGYIPKDSPNPIQCKCTLYYQPNGSSVGQVMVATLYLQNMSDAFRDLAEEYIGDGTKRMQLYVVNQSNEDVEVTRLFRGYY